MTKALVAITGFLLGLLLTLAARAEPSDLYRIGPGDVLDVEVVGHEDLTIRQITVGSDGTIEMPLIGRIVVAPLPLDGAARLIKKRYETDYLRQAYVAVNLVKGAENARINVVLLGYVERPGTYILEKGSSVLTAIAQAGGLKKGADKSDITITNPARSKAVTVDYNELITGKTPGPKLGDGDVINVEENFF